MAFGELNFGRYRMHLSVYNPSDELSRVYTEVLVRKIIESFGKLTDQDIFPLLPVEVQAKLLDGWNPTRETPINAFPIDPRNAVREVELVSRLKGNK